ncbi:MAG TPA: phosphatidylserine decarboxylase [Candidatus Hydrogenedentes bacterium]|nr:phosphatidylserine decarboxylase [Candidatus Hydrogenedentota bacterium]HNT87674.1 phosphatidylserine decarboxylase [Candidatus Hydrogenedentota bacterium]
MRCPFSGWREGARFYVPVLAAGLVLTALLWTTAYVWAGAAVLGLGAAMTLFFRDFPRTVTAGEGEVVSPADGTVVGIDELEASSHYDGPCKRIAIFLSIFSVHVNRSPYDGMVRDMRYAPGKFRLAMKAAAGDDNEANTIFLDTEAGPMTVRQITGAVARRIVCSVTPGAPLAKGEKFGMIRFGSRTELFLPPEARICVKLREKVRAGLTVVARV